MVDAAGVPLVALLSAANSHDSKLLDAATSVRGRARPRPRPGKLRANKGYDDPRCRAHLRRREIITCIARRSVESKKRLGRHRWVVKRSISWLLRYKRLGLRYDRSELTMTALLTLACAHLCYKILTRHAGL